MHPCVPVKRRGTGPRLPPLCASTELLQCVCCPRLSQGLPGYLSAPSGPQGRSLRSNARTKPREHKLRVTPGTAAICGRRLKEGFPHDPCQKRGVESRPGERAVTGGGGDDGRAEPEERTDPPPAAVPGGARAHLRVSAQVPASPPEGTGPSPRPGRRGCTPPAPPGAAGQSSGGGGARPGASGEGAVPWPAPHFPSAWAATPAPWSASYRQHRGPAGPPRR